MHWHPGVYIYMGATRRVKRDRVSVRETCHREPFDFLARDTSSGTEESRSARETYCHQLNRLFGREELTDFRLGARRLDVSPRAGTL